MNAQVLMTTALLATACLAQDVRELTVPTAHGRHYGVTASQIASYLNSGNRLVDLEVDSASPLRFNATYVGNTGAYGAGYWWYTNLTGSQLSANLTNNQARLIDLEAYDNGSGSTRFACIMVPNTGSNGKAWWYQYGVQPSTIANTLAANSARLVDFDSYTLNGNTYYLGVMIRNTGSDYRPFWWHYNATTATINNSTQQNGSRVYCMNRRSNGRFDAVLIDEAQTPKWSWWYNLDAAGVTQKLGNWGHRPINFESYYVNGQRRFAMATINNCNALTTDISQLMRSNNGDGTMGAYLRQLGGSELVGLNQFAVFEPASTIKTLHNVHAHRQMHLGMASLSTLLPVFTNYESPGSSCPIDTGLITETLAQSTFLMMNNSDNARTQAIRAFFGEANINNTANALGMNSTQIRHRLGCGPEMWANPNATTLFDLGQLHEAVSNGYLGNFRDEFYAVMLNNQSWGTPNISTVIDQEGAQLGMSTTAIQSFKAQIELAEKGGSYGWNGYQWRSNFGWIEMPFLVNGQVERREYVAGAFAHRAINGNNADSAVYEAISEMLRPTLRAAMQTWDIVAAVSTPVGTGCGGDASQVYEVFPTNGFDLATSNTSKDIVFDLSGGTVSTTAVSGSPIVTPVSGDLGLSDDENTAPIALGFEIAGLCADTISIASNGYIWLGGEGRADYTESETEFVNEGARVAAYWTDLNPNAGGSIHLDMGQNVARVTYNGVYPFGGSQPAVYAQVEIRPTSIRIRYLPGGGTFSQSVLVGLTNGFAPAVAPGSVDLGGTVPSKPWTMPLSLTGTNPVIGTTAFFHTAGIPANWIGVTTMSIGPANAAGVPLPTPTFVSGCERYVDASFGSLGLILGSCEGTKTIGIPSDLTFVGVEFALQSFAIGPQVIASNGLDCVIGSF